MPCPGAHELEALLQARATPEQEAEWTAHLEGCAQCRQHLESLAAGTELIPNRAARNTVKISDRTPELVRAMENLRRLRPSQFGEATSSREDDGATVEDSGPTTRLIAPATRHGLSRGAPWWCRPLTGASLCVLFGALCLLFELEPADSKLGALSFDLPFRIRGPVRPDEVLIVSMDGDLKIRLNPQDTNHWSRAWHAKLLGQARTLGAELIVFDVTFARSRDDTDADRTFAEALRAAPGKVVLAAGLTERPEGGEALHSIPDIPIASLAGVSAWGLATVVTNQDGRVRRHYWNANASYPSLAWKAAELLGKAPPDPARRRWLNYYGDRTTLRSIPYDRFLEQPVTDTNMLAGRTLFVGWNPTNPDRDEYPTPFTRRPEDTVSGVQIHATAFLNLLRHEWLEELPWPLVWLLIGGAGVGLPLALRRLRTGWMLVCSGAGFLLLLVVACLLTWFQHRWFPWLIIGAVQIPVGLVWSILSRAPRFNPGSVQPLEQTTHPERRAAPAAAEPRRLPEIPDHVTIRCVGRGAYGEVWLARDIIGSFHAVKIIFRNTFARVEPFEREFHGIQKFTPISRLHPGWVHILHVGRNDTQGYFYYIMELGDDESTGQQIDPIQYAARTLSGDLQRRGRLPIEECLTLGVTLANALEHLHQHGLIHRDIKPSNVIFVRGDPKFTDIGLVTEASTRRDVSWVGTQGYMAPEGPGTPAADIFGLGKLIYEAATGRDCDAFPRMPTDTSAGSVGAEWPECERILRKACAEDPAQRYPSAAELRRDLQAVLERQSRRD